MDVKLAETLRLWAVQYNDPVYFREDPIAFPREFFARMKRGEAGRKDVETSAVFAAHLAWGRRSMIVRDCKRLFDAMDWRPYDFVMGGACPREAVSIHRTVKWCDIAAICDNLRQFYLDYDSLEKLDASGMRRCIFGQKEDRKAPNKKINMMRRWMVRRDGKVDLGLWLDTDPADLLIPLDVHVHDVAMALGLTQRRQKDAATVREITDSFAQIFPGDPCQGDFSLFGYGVTHPNA